METHFSDLEEDIEIFASKYRGFKGAKRKGFAWNNEDEGCEQATGDLADSMCVGPCSILQTSRWEQSREKYTCHPAILMTRTPSLEKPWRSGEVKEWEK